MMNFVLKMMNFVLKMMHFCVKYREVEKSLANINEKYGPEDPKLPLETKRLQEQIVVLISDIGASQVNFVFKLMNFVFKMMNFAL